MQPLCADTLLPDARRLLPELRSLKDDLHRHPELSFQETRTTALLKARLTGLGLELAELGMPTGAAALLRGGRPGPTVALRADIDAIAQQEAPREGARSEVPGVMHGCGHDFHTACLWGAARLLSQRREALAGNVVFLFQPAEEITQGARAMLEHGLLEKLPARPRCLFGLHNRPELPAGTIAVMEGPVMAGKSHFTITLHGKAGHGGSPHKCADVIVAASAVVSALQTVVSRSTDPLDSLVCSVLSIHAGTPENFVPDTLTMTGSIRCLKTATMDWARARLTRLTENMCRDLRGEYEIDFFGEPLPPAVNDAHMYAAFAETCRRMGGDGFLLPLEPSPGAEDFAYYEQKKPGLLFGLGMRNDEKGFNKPAHTCDWDIDEAALSTGVTLFTRFVWDHMDGVPGLSPKP